MIDNEKLIPELIQWRKANPHNPNFDIEDWTAINGNIKLAIGYSFLFFPEFIEHDDCIFLKSHFIEDTYNHWKNVAEMYSQIEYVINHIHVVDLFTMPAETSKQVIVEDITKEQVIFLGKKLRDIYEMKLRNDFPERKFIVEFNEVEHPNELDEYELLFYQEKNASRKVNS